jgi:general secretion pathway protein K
MKRALTSRTGARGFIVVAVLWMLAALSTLALIYMTYVTNTAVVVAGSADRIQTEALVTAGVELSVLQLTGLAEGKRPTSGTFNGRIGANRIFVTFRSEAARIDLNVAPKRLLSGLMMGLGARPNDAEGYVNRILAWRSPTAQGEDDPENSFYRTSGAPYIPRHAPFPAAEELWLVRGIPPEIVERMLPFVTVFSNLASINVLDAAPQVLAALPNMTPESCKRCCRSAGSRARSAVADRDGGGEGATLAGSKAYINVDAELTDGRRNAADVVILLLEGGEEPYRVLSWHNASDGGTGPQRAAARGSGSRRRLRCWPHGPAVWRARSLPASSAWCRHAWSG